jgi:hypothetical protein
MTQLFLEGSVLLVTGDPAHSDVLRRDWHTRSPSCFGQVKSARFTRVQSE